MRDREGGDAFPSSLLVVVLPFSLLLLMGPITRERTWLCREAHEILRGKAVKGFAKDNMVEFFALLSYTTSRGWPKVG